VTTLPFERNGRFSVVSGHKHFTKDGQLNFAPDPDPVFKVGYYLTRFGFCVDTNMVIHLNNNQNRNLGARRLLNARSPERPGFDGWLCARQDFLCTSQSFISAVAELAALYEGFFDDYGGCLEEAELHHADPHRVQKLRIAAWTKLTEEGKQFEEAWVREMEAKLKYEKAKSGKYSRVYVNLGDPSSLQGFILMALVKKAQNDEPWEVNGGEIEFCKTPATKSLRRVFRNLINPKRRFFAAVFSDDSCISIRIKGKLHRFNLDISSCDSSHGDSMFQAFVLLFPLRWRGEVLNLLAQTRKDMIFRSVDRHVSVRVKPTGYILPSGSVITTALNTFVVFMIIWFLTCGDVSDTQELANRANLVGYVLTVEKCEQIEDIQFLKHSPCLDDVGEWQPILNPGVLIRSSGTCVRDLPGRGDWKQRGMDFQGSLLKSLYPCTITPLLTNMRRACGSKGTKVMEQFLERTEWAKHIEDDNTIIHVRSEDFFRRYNLTPMEIEQVVEEFGNMEVGYHCKSTGLSKILKKDYGLTCNNISS
jgi:hypothetical protein